MQNAATLLPWEAQGLLDAPDDAYKPWPICDQVIRDFGFQRPFGHLMEARKTLKKPACGMECKRTKRCGYSSIKESGKEASTA